MERLGDSLSNISVQAACPAHHHSHTHHSSLDCPSIDGFPTSFLTTSSSIPFSATQGGAAGDSPRWPGGKRQNCMGISLHKQIQCEDHFPMAQGYICCRFHAHCRLLTCCRRHSLPRIRTRNFDDAMVDNLQNPSLTTVSPLRAASANT